MLLHLLPDGPPERRARPIAPAPGSDFVHLCRPAQLDDVRRRHFAGQPVWVVELDEARLEPARLRDEDLYGHGSFPHYYGEVPPEAVRPPRFVDAVTLADVVRAEPLVRRAFPPTPLLAAPRLSARLGRDIWIKLESTTPIRAFKLRGALVKLEAVRGATGVITASAGNHGLAVSWAARAHGKPATVVVPESANPQKVEAMRGLGAEVLLHGHDYQAALEHSEALAEARGLVSVHAYDDPWIIAGQGTLALELPGDVDTLVASIGGGGLIAGLAVAWKARRPGGRLVGVEPVGADAMARSLEAGHVVTLDEVRTIADGLGARRPSALTLRLTRAGIDTVVRVEDSALMHALRVLLDDERVIAEPAGAAAVAALLARPDLAVGRTVVVLSGANVSDAVLAQVLSAR